MDTYYLNPKYSAYYGVDRVFGARLKYWLEKEGGKTVETALVPDHFRAGSTDKNILRLSLCDPDIVVLCDGIWDTLLNREKYFKEAEACGVLDCKDYGSMDAGIIERTAKALQELYFNNRLSVSPDRYREQLEQIVSYFTRRRRKVFWLSLVVPPRQHRNGVHFAGDYRPLPGWDERLRAINDTAKSVLSLWKGSYVDLESWVELFGGCEKALLDLWHFTEEFHDFVARKLAGEILGVQKNSPHVGTGHVSRESIVHGRTGDISLVTLPEQLSSNFLQSHPRIRTIELNEAPELRNAAIVVDANSTVGRRMAAELLATCNSSVIILYPEELPDVSDEVQKVEFNSR